MLSYKTEALKHRDHDRMKRLGEALDISWLQFRLDDCAAWVITGRHGVIRSYGDEDGDGFQISLSYDTSKAETYAEKRIDFCSAPPIGNGLWLRQLPTQDQAAKIRRAVGLRQHRHDSAETLAALAARRPPVNRHKVP